MSILAVLAASALATAPAPYGHGASSVWVLRPAGPIRSVVVFAHGWKHAPVEPQSWVEQFAPWLGHLLASGNAVIFPRYQLGGEDPGPARVAAFRQGLQLGFRRLGAGNLPTVAVGYSYGASLVFYYAASARRWGLPEPRTVDSIFPVGPVAGAPVAALPSSLRVLIEVGDRDTIAGRSGAEAWWRLLAGVPAAKKRLVVVRSTWRLTADHAAPKRSGPGARAAFWTPLDRLIELARR